MRIDFLLLLTFIFAVDCGCRSIGSKAQLASLPSSEAGLKSLCASGITGACALLGQDTVPSHPLSVLQGVTNESAARFTILVPKVDRPLYYVRALAGGPLHVEPLTATRTERSHSAFAVDTLEVRALNLEARYELLVLGPDGALWDRRVFYALDTANPRGRVSVISCMDDHLEAAAAKMWPQVAAQRPDVILLIGDNVYADHVGAKWQETTPEILWMRYVETRLKLPFYAANPLIPTLATWDDHDFGRNDADRTYAFAKDSMDTFFTFFPQRDPLGNFTRGPGVSSYWRAFGVEFALLDDRTFRSPDKQPLADETHLGEAQEAWLSEHVQAARVPVLLVDGDQFFGAYHPFESFAGSHPRSFKSALAAWRKASVPLLFVSGDRHLSEIMNVPASALGYPTFEVTSSGIHSSVFKDAFKMNPSPNQLVGVAGEYNYSVLEIMRATARHLQISVQAFGINDKLLYQRTLSVNHP